MRSFANLAKITFVRPLCIMVIPQIMHFFAKRWTITFLNDQNYEFSLKEEGEKNP